MLKAIGGYVRQHHLALIALFVALGGGSFAVAALSGSEKRVVKRIANKQITKRAPDLTVKRTNCRALVAGTGQMIKVGPFCIDKYEVSVWSSPKGGTQYGVNSDDYPCNDNGQNCSNIYARSVPGVTPSRFITWFQAQQALVNSGRRLPTSAEWQGAVAGTPDHPGPCNTSSSGPVDTGSAAGCVSRFGAFDMVGNLLEWVADWDTEADACPTWGATPGFGADTLCWGEDPSTGSPALSRVPGARIRGGSYIDGPGAGAFMVSSNEEPHFSYATVGFRGAR